MQKKYRIDDEGRECTICEEYKLWDKFGNHPNGAKGKFARCKECVSQQRLFKRMSQGQKRCRQDYQIKNDGRKCSSCDTWKVWDDFFPKKMGANGFSSMCSVCYKKLQASHYQENKMELDKNHHQWRVDNLDRYRQYQNNRHKDRLQNDMEYRLKSTLRGRVLSALKSKGVYKNTKTSRLVGCTIPHLLTHLNKSPKYSYGEYLIEIDHVIPCNYFNLENPIEQFICFNWRNLQLLSKSENISKGDSLPTNGDELYSQIMRDVLDKHPELRKEAN